MVIFCFLVALFACTIGNICGMGGGVIIKPVLDALNLYPVATINFMSGCTVLCMSAWSVFKVMIKKESAIELRTSTLLAISAAIGGLTKTAVSGSIPTVNVMVLAGMVICGVLGSELGRKINRKLSEKGATLLFEGSMILVMAINVYNSIRFMNM